MTDIAHAAKVVAVGGLNPIEDGNQIVDILNEALHWVSWEKIDSEVARDLVEQTLIGLDSSYGWVSRNVEWEQWFYDAFAQLYVIHKKGR